jgi:hypothetical protein
MDASEHDVPEYNDDEQPLEVKDEKQSNPLSDDEENLSSDEEVDEKVLVSNIQREIVERLVMAAHKSGVSSISTQPVYRDVTNKPNVCKSLILISY